MRRVASFLFCHIVLLLSFTSVLYSQNLQITTNGNVRSGPGTTYEVIGKVVIGEQLLQLEKKGEWFKVRLPNNETGWIHHILITERDSDNQVSRQLLIREKSLGPVVNASDFRFRIDAKISPDLRRVALSGFEDRSDYLIIDGKKGKLYESLYHGEFSPNSKHFAYVAQQDEKWFVVYDGVEGKQYEEISHWAFSSDSKHFGYFAKRDGKWVTVLDGVEIGEVESKSAPLFSPNLKRIAYEIERGGKLFIVLDGVESKPYDVISHITFSPNSQRLVYRAKRGEKFLVIVDGVEGKEHDNISDITFSRNSQRIAYLAHKKGKGYEEFVAIKNNIPVLERREFDKTLYICVLDGVESKEYDEILNLTFSPDSRYFAYFVGIKEDKKVKQTPTSMPGIVKYDLADPKQEKETWFAVVDNNESKPYQEISSGSIVFSPNSQRVAFVALKGNQWCVNVDGEEIACYDDTGRESFTFSPDSRRYAYIAWRGDDRFVVIDRKEGKSYDQVGDPVFSPNSQHVAHVAVRNDRQLIVLDGKENKEYLGVGFPTFGPDSKKLAYYAAASEDKQFLVVDEIEGSKHYHAWFPGAQFVFDAPNKLHFMAIRSGEIFLVDADIR